MEKFICFFVFFRTSFDVRKRNDDFFDTFSELNAKPKETNVGWAADTE